MDIRNSNIRYMVVLNSLSKGGRNLRPVKCSKKKNLEDVVKTMFAKNDCKPVKVNSGMSKSKFLDKNYSEKWMVKRIESLSGLNFTDVMMRGVPDFCVGTSDRKFSFVEIKSLGDSLRASQLRWMTKFERMPLKTAHVLSKSEWVEKACNY